MAKEMDKVLDVFMSSADSDVNVQRIAEIDKTRAALKKQRKALVKENAVLLAHRKSMVFDLMNSLSFRKFCQFFEI